ncbi:MAG: phosphoglycerate dehydrogenase [Anaerolineaceae bacterium]
MKDLKTLNLLVTPASFAQSKPEIWDDLERIFGKVCRNPFARPLTSQELASMITDIDALIAGLDDINAEVFEKANRLQVISRYGVGIEKVNLQAATAHKVIVTNTPGANAVSVAELAIGLMLACMRTICQLNTETRKGQWPRSEGISLRGKTVGLIGIGAIGLEVADRLHPFGCRVIASDPFAKPEVANAHAVELVSLDEVNTTADVISLHSPVTPQTKEMVNKEFLAKVKRGVVIINTARGQLINESALAEALQSGQVRSAGLDVFTTEPPGANNPLFQFPQVVATPHTGAHCDDAITAMSTQAVENLLAVLNGDHPAHIVNPDVLK